MRENVKSIIAITGAMICTLVYLYHGFALALVCLDIILCFAIWLDEQLSKEYLYHVTPEENVESIMREGLRRDAKRRTFAIYLSTEPISWYRGNGERILRVDVSGLSYIEVTRASDDLDELLYWGDIPPTKHTIFGYKPRFKDVTEKYAKTRTKEVK
jgi:hypothetical protein